MTVKVKYIGNRCESAHRTDAPCGNLTLNRVLWAFKLYLVHQNRLNHRKDICSIVLNVRYS